MSFEQDLLSLRAGTLGFDTFARTYRERFTRWAGYFFERWPQSQHDMTDLIQEGLIEAWRAVDRWDPSRGVKIDRFVEYRVGERMYAPLRKALGNPDKRRGFKVVRFVSMDYLPTRFHGAQETAQEARLDAEVLCHGLEGLERDVAAGVLLGANHKAVAAHLYNDPNRRREYRFDSQEHAVRVVRHTVKSMAAKRFPGKPRATAR